MRILQLTAENVKRLKAVEITPDGPVQIVAGRNAQGKSSVLDAIWAALDWKAAGKTMTRPVRDGEDTGKTVLDLGDYIVTRTWDAKKGTTRLLVETPDGTPQQRPQEILDGLVGRLSFDPLAFTQMGDREQVTTLLGLVTLPFNPDEIEAQRVALYDRRHAVGQDVTRAKGALESMPTPDPDLPAQEVPMAELADRYQAAMGEINRQDNIRRNLEDSERALVAAREALLAAEDRVSRNTKSVEDLGPVPELEPIKAQMDAAEATNQAIRAAQGFRQKKAELAGYKSQWDDLNAQMDNLEAVKRDGLAAATFPIGGLSFGEGCITFNGVPFRQASSAEQLKVSLALAMAMNPTLRVIRITDGSLLDADNMAVITQLATDHDFQVWVERVGDGDKAGVVIEDGKVK